MFRSSVHLGLPLLIVPLVKKFHSFPADQSIICLFPSVDKFHCKARVVAHLLHLTDRFPQKESFSQGEISTGLVPLYNVEALVSGPYMTIPLIVHFLPIAIIPKLTGMHPSLALFFVRHIGTP